MKSSSNSEISTTHLKSLTGNLCDISQPYKLFISQHLIYDDSLSTDADHMHAKKV